MKLDKGSLAIFRAAANEQMRYPVDTVRFEPGRVIATNGRFLAVAETGEDGNFEPFLLPKKAVKDIDAAIGWGTKRKPVPPAEVTSNGKKTASVSMPSGETRLVPKVEDAKYPDYEAVIAMVEKEEMKFHVSLSLSLLAEISRIAQACAKADKGRSSVKGGYITISSDGNPIHPVVITTPQSSRLKVYLMPVAE